MDIMYTLRTYQQTAVDKALECFKTKKNGILVLPTGSGKSLIVASIAQQMGGKTIVLQPTKEILEQNKDKMEAFGYHDIGVYSASMGRKDIGNITFATIGSVVKHKHLFADFDRILIDECHKVNSKGGMYESFINGLKLPTLGLTATPYRMRNYRNQFDDSYVAESRILTRTRPRIFNKIVHITQIQELFGLNFLCPLDYEWQNSYDSRRIKGTSTGQGFDETALERYNREQGIVEKLIKLVERTDRKHCLAFTKFTSESERVVEELTKQNISCVEVSAKTKKKDRESIITDFKAGRIKCVVNVGVFTTGFDFPELDCIVLGRPTKSVALYYQMVGRGIRIAEGKDSCRLHDLCDNVKRFGKIETFEIYDQNGNAMWRLKSSAGNLTGIDVNTGKNLEKVAPKKTDNSGAEIITFGKHAGTKISELDKGYLEWCIENFDNGKWKKLFEKELKRREVA